MNNTRVVPARKHVLSILNQDCEAVTVDQENQLLVGRSTKRFSNLE